jgi:hypothetical protein
MKTKEEKMLMAKADKALSDYYHYLASIHGSSGADTVFDGFLEKWMEKDEEVVKV